MKFVKVFKLFITELIFIVYKRDIILCGQNFIFLKIQIDDLSGHIVWDSNGFVWNGILVPHCGVQGANSIIRNR